MCTILYNLIPAGQTQHYIMRCVRKLAFVVYQHKVSPGEWTPGRFLTPDLLLHPRPHVSAGVEPPTRTANQEAPHQNSQSGSSSSRTANQEAPHPPAEPPRWLHLESCHTHNTHTVTNTQNTHTHCHKHTEHTHRYKHTQHTHIITNTHNTHMPSQTHTTHTYRHKHKEDT